MIKLLVKSCRKQSFDFENYSFLLLVLSVGAKMRPIIIMSSVEWLGKLTCLEMLPSESFSCCH